MWSLCHGAARARLPVRGEEPGAETAPGGMCPPQQHGPPGTKGTDRVGLAVGSINSQTQQAMSQVWAGCGSQVRQVGARKEFWCQGRRCTDCSSCLRGTATAGRREGNGCAIKKGLKGSINGTNAKGP